MNTNRSTNYLKSIVNDKSALTEIRKVQASARIFNLEHKLAQAKDPAHGRLVQRVNYFGRLGKNNPARSIRLDSVANVLTYAATIDIYVRTIEHV